MGIGFSIDDEEAKIALFAGVRKTGKSTKQKELTMAWLKSGGRAVVIPSSKYERTFRSVPRIKPENIPSLPPGKLAAIDCTDQHEFGEVLKYCDDILIVCDDIKGYLPSNGLTKEVRNAFISSRHRNVNMTIAMHGLTHAPPEFYDFVNLIFLFRTKDNLNRHRDKFQDLEKMIEVQRQVNEIAHQEKNKYYFKIIEYAE
ncbi:hypothetical protein [Croceimicrobium hydrocarbonivorans]|uniref:Thymidine kinase n=1 Tax=Croceimicrobium hydrocarbonivorans TaxID=2761580 RepID=A0A7H0VB51_9FLAO|nr:hypothetical protein [Croceimicrobium hydrocarbonivorans]QNR22949.1 hypothetical protein H4K34_11225 [Croceimicrobium hydrocarbonivorans]QNR22992.1 hypothetical protein H4K34_11440 [Croceimicrobium hydrocarbonivorans]